MQVLLLNGSTRKNGCTHLALSEAAKTLNAGGVETEIIQMDGGPIRDCIGCNGCAGKGRCVFGDDMVNEVITRAKEADGFVFGSPVYYAHPSGQILSLLDRVFYAGAEAFLHKPAAVSRAARRPGRSGRTGPTLTVRACLKSRRVWIGEWIFCPARQKSAGILTDGKDF